MNQRSKSTPGHPPPRPRPERPWARGRGLHGGIRGRLADDRTVPAPLGVGGIGGTPASTPASAPPGAASCRAA